MDDVGWYEMEVARVEECKYTHCRATVYDHKSTTSVDEIPARTGLCVGRYLRYAQTGVVCDSIARCDCC